MHQVPNWFRWLVIAIATLILCACRAPLQEGQPLLPPIVPIQEVISSRDVVPALEPTAAVVLRGKTLQSTLAKLRGNNASLPPEPAPKAISHIAPVVRTTENGVELQQIDLIRTGSTREHASSTLPNRMTVLASQLDKASDHAAQSPTSVYLQLDDDTGKGKVTVAQLDSVTNSGVGSPFEDDPPVLIPNSPTIGPGVGVVEYGRPHEVIIEDQPITSGITPQLMNNETLMDPPAFYDQYQVYEETPAAEYPVQDCPVEVVSEHDLAGPAVPSVPAEELSRLYPDEYICDGGDAGGRVAVKSDWSLRNLDPEDTIGHYDTLDHRVVVEPSNRVCIYAPRFAAARKVTTPFQAEKQEQLMVADRETLAVVGETRQQSDLYSQTLAAQRHLSLQPASSLKVRQPGVEGISRQALHVLDHDLSLHENLRVMKFGIHKQSEKAQLAEFASKAVSWSHDKAVQVVVDEVVAQTRESLRGTGSIFVIGDNGPAKLRVIKTASTADALPGEEVEFTLRFDNLGFQPIGNVTIIDNLTTRLEFIKDSDLCSMDCEFLHDENDVESLTLRWEIRDPIKPGQGGLIRFRCRVR